MTIVVDSSITACWCLPDDTSPVADRALSRMYLGEPAIAPFLWWYRACDNRPAALPGSDDQEAC
jgi:hypothetical protein